jgi:hypothetical protein
MSGPTTLSRTYRMLNVLDEFTHECLAIRVGNLMFSCLRPPFGCRRKLM